MKIRNQFRNVALSRAAVTLGIALALPSTASVHVNTTTGMALAGAPLVIYSYDPVAYFTEGRAAMGKATYSGQPRRSDLSVLE